MALVVSADIAPLDMDPTRHVGGGDRDHGDSGEWDVRLGVSPQPVGKAPTHVNDG